MHCPNNPIFSLHINPAKHALLLLLWQIIANPYIISDSDLPALPEGFYILSKFSQNPLKSTLLLSSFYWWGNWGTESFCKLPKGGLTAGCDSGAGVEGQQVAVVWHGIWGLGKTLWEDRVGRGQEWNGEWMQGGSSHMQIILGEKRVSTGGWGGLWGKCNHPPPHAKL